MEPDLQTLDHMSADERNSADLKSNIYKAIDRSKFKVHRKVVCKALATFCETYSAWFLSPQRIRAIIRDQRHIGVLEVEKR